MLNNKYYTQDQHGPYEFYSLGDFQLESGEILNNAQLAYAVHGKLNEAKDNVILFTIMFSGTSKNMEHYIGARQGARSRKILHHTAKSIGWWFVYFATQYRWFASHGWLSKSINR